MHAPRYKRRKVFIVLGWLAIGALTFLGVLSAGLRVADVVEARRAGSAPLSTLSSRERWALDRSTAIIQVPEGSPRYREIEAAFATFGRTYVVHARSAFLHIIPGALFLVLATMQFSARIRRRYPAAHRWNGRTLLTLAAAIGLSGIYLGLRAPFGGPGESVAAIVFGGFFLGSASRSYVAIRRGDVAAHREWMLRMYAVALGVAVIRLIGLPWSALPGRPQDLFVLALWSGWILTLGLAEWWIRHTRPQLEAVQVQSTMRAANAA